MAINLYFDRLLLFLAFDFFQSDPPHLRKFMPEYVFLNFVGMLGHIL